MARSILAAVLISSVKVSQTYCDTKLLILKKVSESGISRFKGEIEFPRAVFSV